MNAMRTLRTLIWDLDGTIAETERDGHRVAFNLAFEDFGLPWRWSEAWYGRLLRIAGGRERLLADMPTHPEAPYDKRMQEILARSLHARKTVLYARLVDEGAIPLREGVVELMDECRDRGVRMAIATTTSRANVEALLCRHLGAGWREGFAAVVCGEDVQRKKPDPEVFEHVLRLLAVTPRHAVAIEDSPLGAVAARAAGIPVLVTRSAYFADAAIEDAIALGPGLHDRAGWRPDARAAAPGRRIGLDDIEAWLASAEVSQGA
jgi:HAD superfamily hydrolase (TIGR01509 family)